MPAHKKPTEHGTLRQYNAYGCRCEPCKKAKSIQKKAWRKRTFPDARKYAHTDYDAKTRECSACLKTKPFADFVRSSTRAGGISYQCKTCHGLRTGEYAQTPRGRFITYKTSAKYRGIPFLLTEDEFLEFWDKPCFYCNSAIEGIGIDRRDHRGPYALGNVVPACSRCNLSKCVLTVEEFVTMCQEVAERFPRHISQLKQS